MSGGLVDDVGSGRVGKVIERTHLARDRQNSERLKLHEDGGGDKAVHRDGAPTESLEAGIHLLDARNAFGGNTRLMQAVDVLLMGVVFEKVA